MNPKFVPTYPTPRPAPKAPPPVRKEPPTPTEIKAAVAALRSILLARRSSEQGGYPGRRKGSWDGSISALGGPDNLDALFAFAGITPDEIEPRGDCKDCVNSDDGRERGYARPCVDCTRPYNSNFVPRDAVGRRTGATR